MRFLKFGISVAAVAMAASTAVSAQSPQKSDRAASTEPATVAVPAKDSSSAQFATLRGIKAAPMASSELKAVKGLHVHFFVDSQNDQYFGVTGLHIAGDINSGNFTNWENRGGSDGKDVAPSYSGLCVATGVGVGGIIIPEAAVECP